MILGTFRPWSEFHAEYMKSLDLDEEYDDDDFWDDEEEEFIDFSPEGIARMYERGDLGDLDEPEYEPQKSSIDPIRKVRAQREARIGQMKGYGGFYFLFYDDALFEKLSNADLVRLLFLASYMPYSDKGYVLQRGNQKVRKEDCAKILRLSSKAFYNFWNFCEANQLLSLNKNNEVVISKKYFRRGDRNKNEFKSRKFTRIHTLGIRHLYVTTDVREHKKLGYLYKLIPHVNAQHNIVCSNPWEESKASIEDITISALTDLWKYHISNFSRLKDDLLRFELESGEKALLFSENDKGGQRIIINPKLFYAGDDYRAFLDAGLFDRNT